VDAVRRVLRHEPLTDATAFQRLHAAGVLAGGSPAEARPRCQLYATYLTRNLG
jgi:hypothetical protein